MLNVQLAKKYARAIFEIAQDEDKLKEYGSELASVAEAVAGSDDLRAFLADPQIQPDAKKSVLQQIFQDDVSTDVMHFLMLLVDKRRIALVPEIDAQFQQMANAARGVIIADVTTAMEMSALQIKKLRQKLQQVTGGEVKLRRHVDAAILGGVVVRIGDRRIDGSVRGRLQALGQTLMASK
jgi:F-type H+-transporting ATPase subunit delta